MEVSGGAKLVFDVHEKNSINNRFVPLKGVRTDAVFNVDDDMIVDCRSVLFAFETWRASSETLVGFNPRLHSTPRHYLEKTPLSQRSLRFEPKRPGAGVEEKCPYRYRHYWYVWWHGVYSMVLTKAAFCHHKYFEMYTNDLPKAVWDFVHENKNCEDIAMQFMISNATGLPPSRGSVPAPTPGVAPSHSKSRTAWRCPRSSCSHARNPRPPWGDCLCTSQSTCGGRRPPW